MNIRLEINLIYAISFSIGVIIFMIHLLDVNESLLLTKNIAAAMIIGFMAMLVAEVILIVAEVKKPW